MVEQNRIVKALSGFYYVQTPDGVVECRARGRFRKEGVTPLVGDLVEITLEANGKGTVDAILPRRNSCVRRSQISTCWSCWPPAPSRKQNRF